jgi:hypothetical protein
LAGLKGFVRRRIVVNRLIGLLLPVVAAYPARVTFGYLPVT